MSSLLKPILATQHLNQPPRAVDGFTRPDPERPAKPHPKTYRLVLHSADRLAGSTATDATFDVGDLASQWALDKNLDAGKAHYTCHVSTFNLVCSTAAPTIVEVRGSGWPHQSESWDSWHQGPTRLLTVASSAITCWTEADAGAFTLSAVPSGRLGVRLIARDMQTDLDADASLAWHMLISITPSQE